MMAPHHNFVVIPPMILKFDTGVKVDVLYTMAAKKFRHHYYYVVMVSYGTCHFLLPGWWWKAGGQMEIILSKGRS